MNYDGIDTLSFAITNTSSMTAYLTSFAFNVPVPPANNVTGFSSFTATNSAGDPVSGWSGLSDFNAITGEGDVNVPNNLGYFDMAGITGPNASGGDTADGIDLNETYYFTFTLTGDGIGSLETADFLMLSNPQNSNSILQYIVVRFQGMPEGAVLPGGGIIEVGEGSDVAVTTTSTAAPIPAAIFFLGSGLLGLVGLRRKYREN